MRNLFSRILAFALCLTTVETLAQLPIANNGKFLDVKGVKIYYEETGKGHPLLLLHGFGQTTEEWKPFISDLSKSWRVIAIDLPGHGRSDQMDSSNNYLHKKAADLVLSFCETMKLDSLRIMGFSSGALITLNLAIMKPELAHKIIVIAGQLYYSEDTRKFISSLGGPDNFINDPSELRKVHGPKKGKQIALQFYNFRNLYGDPAFTPDMLATIAAQTLIIHGDDDPVAPVENAFEMYRHIPNAHLWVVPFGEHVEVLSSSNRPEFIRVVSGFLNRK